MAKSNVGNPWETGKTNSERKGYLGNSPGNTERRDDSALLRRLEKENLMKLPALWAELPGKEIAFLIVPLYPAYKAGRGTCRPREYENTWSKTPETPLTFCLQCPSVCGNLWVIRSAEEVGFWPTFLLQGVLARDLWVSVKVRWKGRRSASSVRSSIPS